MPVAGGRGTEASVKAMQALRHGGFTLVEVMIVVLIIGILGALAAPSFSTMLQNNRVQAAASALQVSLSLARSEAVKRGSGAMVTVAARGVAGRWERGWTVFLDKTGNANSGIGLTVDGASGTRLEVVSALSSPQTLYGQTGSLNYFTYNSSGRLVTSSGASSGASANRTFWFYEGGSNKQCLVISLTGRVRIQSVPSASACDSD